MSDGYVGGSGTFQVIAELAFSGLVIMDVVTGLSITTCGKYATRIAMDIFTKSVNFLVIKKTYRVDQLVQIYISVIVRLLGVYVIMILDRD